MLTQRGDGLSPRGVHMRVLVLLGVVPLVFISLAELSDAEQIARDAACDSCVVDDELRLTAAVFRFADRNDNGHFSRDPRELDWFIPRATKDIAQFM